MSDPLQFTGIDMGDRGQGTRRSYIYQGSDDEDDMTSSDYDGAGGDGAYDGSVQLALQEKEEALVESALARIQRAQDRGKKEVKLSKEELAALDRRRRRIEEEQARRASAASASGSERRRRSERFSVPIAQLEPSPEPTPRKKKKKGKASPAGSDDSLPRHPLPADMADDPRRQALPPMGYFPPPSATRSRPRSATSLSQRPPSRAMDERLQAPPHYASLPRHVSDSMGTRPRSSRSPLPPDDAWQSNVSPASSRRSSVSRNPNRQSMDPFMFQTENSRAPYTSGAGASSRRQLSGTLDPRRASVAAPAAARGGRGSRRPSPDETSDATSETSDLDSSDDHHNGVQIVEPPRRGRREQIVVEEDPPTARQGSRGKKSGNSSPVKKKPVGSGRKKKK